MPRFSPLASLISLRRAALLGCALLSSALVSAQTITSFSPTYGTVGSDVTITGTGFLTVQSVLLNGQKMRVKSNTGTSLLVTIPTSASTGQLRVTTSAGTVLSGKGFRVTRVSTSFSYPVASSATATGVGNLGDYSTPAIADLDNDGLLDLIIGYGDGANNTNGGTLRRFEQASATDGNFTSSTTLTPRTLTFGADATAATNPAITVANYAKPWLTDLDNDGLLDLLIGETGGTVVRYEQSSLLNPNNFTAYGVLFANPDATTPANRYYARPTVTDLDNDGLLDILVGASDGFIHHYEQKTAGAVTAANFNDYGNLKTSGGVAIDGGNVSKAQVIDIDGDGILDLLIGNAAGQVLQYKQSAIGAASFDQVGTGSFNNIALGNGQYAAPLMADVDGDGLLDLLLGNYNLASGDVQHYEQSIGTSTPLPVVLSSFTGKTITSGAQLRWTTAQEVNSAAFVVEHSTDGRTFTDLATLAAAGTSSAAHSYDYTDASAASRQGSIHYYRLRQLDQDGTVAYSSVVTLSRAAAAAGAYPNPFTEALYVTLPGPTETQPVTATLLSLGGQPVYAATLQLGAVARALPGLPELAPGIYVLRLTTAAGTTTQRVSRQ
ncbi:FG-GAP-like repeat-containing protein [Hymenobacter persicinus]|uniref:T9SS type A sorting domain-containing protein n=1 Tax=Hymenobacter persicinus TaxID=2025506 RepID=A0A4Q5LAX4_9BACT|nr:FG-GAP-like repeat-containing protein [Hymenobacter persicinus]RYU79164.1 T9SS type A sorting domain-containing protein [Hymenobacter persicinus]